jgi:hypothetical protein
MVTIEGNTFTIRIDSEYPAADFLSLYNDIIDVLQVVDNDVRRDNYYYLLELLREMMPDGAALKKMTK